MVLKSLVFAAVNLGLRTVEHTYIWTFGILVALRVKRDGFDVKELDFIAR